MPTTAVALQVMKTDRTPAAIKPIERRRFMPFLRFISATMQAGMTKIMKLLGRPRK